jgi:transcription-repair coupling factor (superfamily II helicase)
MIIESGIDIPNVNTIIVNNAQTFGLSDLHQLRGRVGRFNRAAYAYFLIPRRGVLDSEAQKRLSAIQEHAHLGAGFKIAMEDLEIRGAGNLLGIQQHGYISAIGFDLYCRLLREAIGVYKKSGVFNA